MFYYESAKTSLSLIWEVTFNGPPCRKTQNPVGKGGGLSPPLSPAGFEVLGIWSSHASSQIPAQPGSGQVLFLNILAARWGFVLQTWTHQSCNNFTNIMLFILSARNADFLRDRVADHSRRPPGAQQMTLQKCFIMRAPKLFDP